MALPPVVSLLTLGLRDPKDYDGQCILKSRATLPNARYLLQLP
jgi:hypothetical protein